MKGLVLMTVLLSTLVPQVSAYGPRGAAERILYYYAYLAEQITVTDPQQRMIASGLGDGTKPLDFNEFCKEIWAPMPEDDDNTRPKKVAILKPGEVFEDLDIEQLIVKISDPETTDTKKPLNRGTDYAKIYKGSEGYSSAMRRVPAPLADLAKMPPVADASVMDHRNKLIAMGRKAVQTVVDTRMQDFVQHRIDGALANERNAAKKDKRDVLFKKKDLVTVAGRDVSGRYSQHGAKVLDGSATIDKFKKTGGGAEAAFRDALAKHDSTKRAWAHRAALENAQAAERNAGCS